MQPETTTIPCPHCGAKLPMGARFCGDCGKAIAPTRRAPLPDELTKVDLSAPAAPSPPGKKRPPLPDEVTELDLSTEAAPAAPDSRQSPLPDDITVIDPAAEAPAARPRRAPLPDDITVMDVSAEAAPSRPRRAPLPDEATVVDLPGGPPGVSQSRNVAPAPGSPGWGTVPGQSIAGAGWSQPAAGSLSQPSIPSAVPIAGNPPFPGPQPVAAPLSRPPVPNGGQPAAPPSTPFPAISGNFSLKKRTVLSTTGGKIALVVLVLLIIAGGVSIFFILQSINRHGLPSDIPLPNNASYVQTIEQYSQDPAAEAWVYTVSNTQPSQVIAFYQAQLPGSGWGKIARSTGNAPGLPKGDSLAACKGSKGLQVVVANQGSIEGVSPPSGGVVLEIILGPASDVPFSCR